MKCMLYRRPNVPFAFTLLTIADYPLSKATAQNLCELSLELEAVPKTKKHGNL